MNTNKISTITGVIIVLTLVLFFSGKNKNQKGSEYEIVGNSLLSEEVVKEMDTLIIENGSDSIKISKDKNEGWLLNNHHNIPVDFEKLSTFANELLENKVERFVSSKKETMDRLEFGDKRVLIKYAGKDFILNIGKEGKSEGSFIQYLSDKSAYLSDKSLDLNTDKNHWIEKKPFKGLQADDIQSISLKSSNLEMFSFSRATKEDEFDSVRTPDGMSLNQTEINSLIENIINLQFTDSRSLEDSEVQEGMQKFQTLVMKTFETEDTFTLEIGRKPEEVIENEIQDSAQEGKEPQNTTIPAGPVVVKFNFSDEKNIWNLAQKETAFIASSYSFNQFDNVAGKVYEESSPEQDPGN